MRIAPALAAFKSYSSVLSKSNIQILILSLLYFFLGFIVINAWNGLIFIETTHFITLAAAFFGSLFAFLLQSSKDKDQITQNQLEAFRQANFLMMAQINKLLILDEQILRPYKRASRKMDSDARDSCFGA